MSVEDDKKRAQEAVESARAVAKMVTESDGWRVFVEAVKERQRLALRQLRDLPLSEPIEKSLALRVTDHVLTEVLDIAQSIVGEGAAALEELRFSVESDEVVKAEEERVRAEDEKFQREIERLLKPI